MYTSPASLVLGFHGCDRDVGERVLAGSDGLCESKNSYDWLGHGIYFWENNPERAREFAVALLKNPPHDKEPITEPFVLGAVIDLGICLNLLESNSIRLVRAAYDLLCTLHETSGTSMPENRRTGRGDLRCLDCAVIETLHASATAREYDSVRGVFVEGSELYPNSGFHEKNHIQICIRNPKCVRGYFRPFSTK